MNFILPANMGAGFMVSGSAYIKATVNITQANAYSWAFKQTGAGSSIVQSMVAMLSGQAVETIQHYGKLYNSLLLHATNANFLVNDSHLEEDTFPGAFEAVASLDICIPVALGLFNAKQHLPLFLLSSAQLQVNLASVVDALTQGSADAITAYTVSNASLIFEQIVPDSQYEMGIKQLLASRVYQMGFNTFMNQKYGQQASVTQNIGLNSSSVKAVLWNSVPLEGQRNTSAPTDGGQTSCYVYADGALVSNDRLSSTPVQFLEMNRCLNNMYDVSRTSVAPATYTAGNAGVNDIAISACTRASYASGGYLGGLSLARTNEAGFAMGGTPVNTMVVQWTGTATTGSFYIYVAVEQVLTVDISGSCNLIR
jgi:hypothetical protein